MRFLAGLALLAASFLAPAPAVAAPAPPHAVVSGSDAPVAAPVAAGVVVSGSAQAVAPALVVAAPVAAGVVVGRSVEAPATVTDQAPVIADEPVAVTPIEVEPAAVAVEAGTYTDGECQRALGSRAPPRA